MRCNRISVPFLFQIPKRVFTDKLKSYLFVSVGLNGRYFSYELQVSSQAKRTGLGRALMEYLDVIGQNYNMQRIMLTVLKGLHCSKFATFIY